jgi:hypothetical protein
MFVELSAAGGRTSGYASLKSAGRHMNQPLGTLLFVTAVVGNAFIIAAGLMSALVVVVGRGIRAARHRQLVAREHDSAFHHPDRIRTPLGEWVFMAGACAAVLVGLPVALAVIFQFVLPLLGRAWSHG